MSDRLVDITCELRGETDRAYRIYDGTKTEWVPKSQVELDIHGKGIDGKDVIVATMPEWLAKERGFI